MNKTPTQKEINEIIMPTANKISKVMHEEFRKLADKNNNFSVNDALNIVSVCIAEFILTACSHQKNIKEKESCARNIINKLVTCSYDIVMENQKIFNIN